MQHLAPVLQQRGERLLVMGTNVASKLPPSMQGLAQELPAMDFEVGYLRGGLPAPEGGGAPAVMRVCIWRGVWGKEGG